MNTTHVIRHGETDYNLEKKYQGRLDPPLNEAGRAQVLAIAETMTRLTPTRIFCSPLLRALETAEIIADRLDIETIIDDRLTERSLGVYENLTKTAAAARFPELYARNITRLFDDAPTGGETPREVYARVAAFMTDMLRDGTGHDALIVTHGFVAKAIDAYFNPGKDDPEFFAFSLQNGEIASYELGAGSETRLPADGE